MLKDSFIKVENVYISNKIIKSLNFLQCQDSSSWQDSVYDNSGIEEYEDTISEISDFIMDIFHTQDIENKEKMAMDTLLKLRDIKQLICSFKAPDLTDQKAVS